MSGSTDDGVRALEMRESGATYQQIADGLDISKGKAHHLVRLAHEELGSDREGPSLRLTSEDRKERDLRIVLARLRGSSTTDIATAFEVTPRHVRRLMERWRRGADHGEKTAVEGVHQRLQQLLEAREEAKDDADRADDSEERVGALLRVARLSSECVAAASNQGMSRSDLYAAILDARERARSDERIEVLREVNGHLREVLAERGTPDAFIEEIIDEVLVAGGFSGDA
jgi:transposase